MEFKYKPPAWRSPGVEPQENLKNDGFQAGYKPPAAYFNWFFHGVFRCLEELQEAAGILDKRRQIVVMEQDIPMEERKPGTFYLRVTDSQTITVSDQIRVSPNVGMKVL